VFKAPESSVSVGLVEATVVYAVYMQSVPNMTDVRAANPHDSDVEASRKRAAWLSAGFVGLVFLLTQDRNSALIGAAAIAGLDAMVKHANAVHPGTGKMAESQGANGAAVDNDTAMALPDYGDDTNDQGYGGAY
jgi:hypothetical protein